MGFYDNSLNSFQGVQADSLLVNRSSSNESSNLTIKQPISNLDDIQTADSSASAIDGAVGSSQSATKMTPSIGAMIKFFSTLPNVNGAETAGSTPNQDDSQTYLQQVVDQLVQANNPSVSAIESPEEAEFGEEYAEEAENTDKNEEIS